MVSVKVRVTSYSPVKFNFTILLITNNSVTQRGSSMGGKKSLSSVLEENIPTCVCLLFSTGMFLLIGSLCFYHLFLFDVLW